jgi:hypothetical protein
MKQSLRASISPLAMYSFINLPSCDIAGTRFSTFLYHTSEASPLIKPFTKWTLKFSRASWIWYCYTLIILERLWLLVSRGNGSYSNSWWDLNWKGLGTWRGRELLPGYQWFCRFGARPAPGSLSGAVCRSGGLPSGGPAGARENT